MKLALADLESISCLSDRRTEVIDQYLNHTRSLDALIDRHEGKLAPQILAEAHKVLKPSPEDLDHLSTACIASIVGYRQKKGQVSRARGPVDFDEADLALSFSSRRTSCVFLLRQSVLEYYWKKRAAAGALYSDPCPERPKRPVEAKTS